MSGNSFITHSGTQKDRREKEKSRREFLSKYIYDVSKIIVAGMLLINLQPLIQGDFNMPTIVATLMSTTASITLAWIGNRILIY